MDRDNSQQECFQNRNFDISPAMTSQSALNPWRLEYLALLSSCEYVHVSRRAYECVWQPEDTSAVTFAVAAMWDRVSLAKVAKSAGLAAQWALGILLSVPNQH